MALDVQLLKGTFELVKPHAKDVSDKFYEYLWGDYPASQALFENVNMEKQKSALVNSLVYIVDNLENSDNLVKYLEAMGSRHINYGTEVAHYDLVGATLIKTLKYFFKRLWTEEAESQWSEAYGVISSTMIQGAEKKPLENAPKIPEIEAVLDDKEETKVA